MFSCQYIDKLLNVFNVSMFLNFFNVLMLKFDILGQKGSQNFYFLKNTLIFLLKVRKQKMRILRFALVEQLSIYRKNWKYCQDGKKMKKFQHWSHIENIENIWHWIEFNVESFRNIDIALISMFIFLTLKTSNRNQCQCRCRPLVYSESITNQYRTRSSFCLWLIVGLKSVTLFEMSWETIISLIVSCHGLFQTVEHMESDMTAEEVHSELVKENIVPLKIENQEDAVKAASAEVIEALTIGVAQEAGWPSAFKLL